MAIEWGATSGYEQVGIDVRTDAYNTNTPSINVYIDYWVRSTGYGFNDKQTLTAYGSAAGVWREFQFTAPANSWTQQHVGTLTLYGLGQSYGGGPYYAFGAVISGSFNGGTPRHERGFTLPARPPNVPNPPGAPTFSNITSSNVRVSAAWPGDNGAGIVEWQFMRAYDASFTSGVGTINHNGNVLDMGGLERARQYAFAVRARNAVGWSSWSPTTYARTASTIPDAPALPTIDNVGPDGANVNWKQPNDGGTAMSTFHIQTATDEAFTKNVAQISDSTTPATVTGLNPGVKHWARVRGVNPIGNGVWSPAATFETLSGATVKVAGAWKPAKAWVRVDNAWRLTKVHKKVGGSWRL